MAAFVPSLPADFQIRLGSCIAAAEIFARQLLEAGVDGFQVVEGWVTFAGYGEESESTHTWIEMADGTKCDPTVTQFRAWGFEPEEVEYAREKARYSGREYLAL